MDTPKVKICCIQDADEAQMAIQAGAWALGLVAEMPSGVGPIPDGQIADILSSIPRQVETFLLSSRVEADALIEHHRACPATTLQLVDHVPYAELYGLREALPKVRLVQVIHVQDEGSVEEAVRVAPLVDMILLDSGKPDADFRTLGGTGDTHDWQLSLEIRRRIGIPMFLAGGLEPANVADAIRQVQPFGVDLCSRIRDAEGRLVPEKLEAFMAAVGSAGGSLK